MKVQNLNLIGIKFWTFIVVSYLLFPKFIFAVGQLEIETKSYFMCRLEGEVRTIRSQKRPDGSCYVNYTKKGIDQKISESKTVSNCPSIGQKIKSNLELAGWKCKNISTSLITDENSK